MHNLAWMLFVSIIVATIIQGRRRHSLARELAIRIVGGLIYAPISFLVFYWGGVPLAILAVIAAAICAVEFYLMMAHAGFKPYSITGIIVGVLFVVDAHLKTNSANIIVVGSVVFALARMVADEWQPREISGEARRKLLLDWLITLFGAFYTGGLISYGVLLRDLPNGWALALFAILGTAASDIFAFFIGRFWGRHKLAPSISPKKTVEGAIGGLMFSTLTGLILGQVFGFPLVQATIFGFIIGLVSIAGDLGESVLKRSGGVKDAGTWIPGQGGLLDVVDGFLFALVIVYLYGKFVL